jgi:hypothetical protein
MWMLCLHAMCIVGWATIDCYRTTPMLHHRTSDVTRLSSGKFYRSNVIWS